MFDPNMNAVVFHGQWQPGLGRRWLHPNPVIVNWTQRSVYVAAPVVPLQQSSLKFFHDRDLK